MKILITYSFVAFLSFIFCPAYGASKNASTSSWQLVWADEFNTVNGPVNKNKWKHETGGHGWGNQEQQYYTDRSENSRIENGMLVIESRKEKYAQREYTSARLNSAQKWRYGRFEFKAVLPQGRGSWPAFWMLSESLFNGKLSWPECGEIDIMEHVGYAPGVIVSSLHSKAHNWMTGTQKTGRLTIEEPFSKFHVYAMEWRPDLIQFFVDDQLIYQHKKETNADFKSWPFDQEFRIILNNAIGGTWGGENGIDDSSFPQKMFIDYVRVYQ